MSKSLNFTSLILLILLLAGCAPPPPSPTPFPTYTSLPTHTPTIPPTITFTPEPTSTSTETPTPLPPPVCTPGVTVSSPEDNSLPGYIDILDVSTKLKGSNLTVVFTLSWLPSEILINRSILSEGSPEIGWGVAIDTDNDPATGGASFFSDSGYGYEYVLQALNYKQGEELPGDIKTLFNKQTNLWSFTEDSSFKITSSEKIQVNESENTLTLSAVVKNIKKNSYLHFFAVYYPKDNVPLTDEICNR